MPTVFFRTRVYAIAVWLVLLGLCNLSLPASAQGKPCAVLLIHGKWGQPGNLAGLGRQLEPVCDTKLLEMPWSRRRNYDQPYAVALQEMAAEVRALRGKGYTRVLLAGHSLGANGVLAYMAEVGDVDGLIALAPGHAPEVIYRRGIGKAAVDQARVWVAEGKGAETLDMEDLNQGKTRMVRMRADVLLSYFDPQGLGYMPATAARFKQPVPLLWVVGAQDPLSAMGPDYAYSKAPAHPARQYLAVDADHMGTPDVAAAQVLQWIRALP
ncbi:alpha/beta hydrolase [Rhodoferax saidenbachensis]|uniref:Pimeloyl-ACP methyl ester carboxylesterase n=1 Tax=Rhodoferax saidenbachensis TaxID=1484693 RepID=A0ABU1ZIG5_9BURK|nr:alpha/beta hydrolase [Rhodoferax saidenbachensis]MDR7305332.1 pimeloyl-ACP methyl ester carboxylesterase [Rhodoferax saidenbachensis]